MRIRALTLVLALLAGVGLAGVTWVVGPSWLALVRIASPDPETAWKGWRWLLAEGTDGEIRAARRLPRIQRILETASNPTMLEAGAALRRAGLWGWERQPRHLVLRELSARGWRGETADIELIGETMLDCPRDLDPETALPLFQSLLDAGSRRAVEFGRDGACAWVGRHGAERLLELTPREDDPATRRDLLLALAWASPPVAVAPARGREPEIDEAVLLVQARGGDPRGALARLAEPEGPDRPAVEYILRHCPDPDALRALQRRAEDGDRTAAHAVQARSRERDDAQSRRVVRDPTRPSWQRRLAAWRLDDVDAATIAAVLEDDPTEPNGSVYAWALLAERRLEPAAAASLAAAWITDLDDRRKRAGAVLAALLGAHGDLLERAEQREDVAVVRTTQRLALLGLGRPVGGRLAGLEFAHRTLHRPDGEFDPDAALCLLLTESRETVGLLTVRPVRPDRASIQARAWLIERFLPGWHEDVGRPIGGPARTVNLHFDLLRARWRLTRRDLVFDETTRTFREP